MRKSTAGNQRQLQDLHGERNYRVFCDLGREAGISRSPLALAIGPGRL
jgi:hypothetical protein